MIHVLKIILNEVCNKCDIHSILKEYCLTCKSFWKVMLIWFISLKRMSSDYMLKTLNILTLNVNIIFLWKFFQNNINIALLPSLIGKYLSVWDVFWREICLYVFYTHTHTHTHTHTYIYVLYLQKPVETMECSGYLLYLIFYSQPLVWFYFYNVSAYIFFSSQCFKNMLG